MIIWNIHVAHSTKYYLNVQVFPKCDCPVVVVLTGDQDVHNSGRWTVPH